jgi:glucan phosphoethanolaminetransferase (alkaline phosphatase superfamily)
MGVEPNKYSKNANIKPDSLWKTLISIITFILIVIAIVGLSFEFFKESSVLQTSLAWLFESTTHMLLIPVIGLAFWFFSRWTASPKANKNPSIGNLPLNFMIALGVYYAYQLYTTGSL